MSISKGLHYLYLDRRVGENAGENFNAKDENPFFRFRLSSALFFRFRTLISTELGLVLIQSVILLVSNTLSLLFDADFLVSCSVFFPDKLSFAFSFSTNMFPSAFGRNENNLFHRGWEKLNRQEISGLRVSFMKILEVGTSREMLREGAMHYTTHLVNHMFRSRM